MQLLVPLSDWCARESGPGEICAVAGTRSHRIRTRIHGRRNIPANRRLAFAGRISATVGFAIADGLATFSWRNRPRPSNGVNPSRVRDRLHEVIGWSLACRITFTSLRKCKSSEDPKGPVHRILRRNSGDPLCFAAGMLVIADSDACVFLLAASRWVLRLEHKAKHNNYRIRSIQPALLSRDGQQFGSKSGSVNSS